ncbi:MAG TPA: YraN family protein [Steroidobacteraceae bacterium]|nr:YraN family protein [Steroidobacteraceae bacterium]
MDRQALGAQAEGIARRHLTAHGLELVCENYRCRVGELDLVMRERGTLVIVEVRMRRASRFGGARASIHGGKKRRIVRAAQHLLMTHRALARLPVRFDVVTLDRCADAGEGVETRVEWSRAAFEAPP